MNRPTTVARIETTEAAPAAVNPILLNIAGRTAGSVASPDPPAVRAARATLAWDLLGQLQGHPYRPGCVQPGSHNVDDVTVDWLDHVAAPEDWEWLVKNFDHRAHGWPTVSLFESLLKTRHSRRLR